ncbi:MAG: serine/threonine protein kinase, partial [Deltaproteobacteria bacterium]|nr:serine/threonine protein kinase [Deltaproteobacteria bacterium]
MSAPFDPYGSTTEAAAEMYCTVCDRSYAEGIDHCPLDGTQLIRLDQGQDPRIGMTLDGRYRIERRLGAGGMGVVYRAVDSRTGGRVAIKLIGSDKAVDIGIKKRFLREAKLLGRLAQRNIVEVLEFGQTREGQLFLAMEYLDGDDLERWRVKHGVLSPAELCEVGQQICAALEAAHELEIVHRDLKPANVMVVERPDGPRFKVLD